MFSASLRLVDESANVFSCTWQFANEGWRVYDTWSAQARCGPYRPAAHGRLHVCSDSCRMLVDAIGGAPKCRSLLLAAGPPRIIDGPMTVESGPVSVQPSGLFALQHVSVRSVIVDAHLRSPKPFYFERASSVFAATLSVNVSL
jgi:hypothetical protein